MFEIVGDSDIMFNVQYVILLVCSAEEYMKKAYKNTRDHRKYFLISKILVLKK